MRNKTTGVLMLDIDRLHPHPNNPRKDLGDLEELVESIKKNGVLQNLTVLPLDEDYEEFRVLIGHRRLAAAKKAGGIYQLPCSLIEDIPLSEQIAIMLEENMQRNELTYLEQADSFQMMLDLGETVGGIAEKTGFSESTIRRRIEIAKLDREVIHNREDQGMYQFCLADYEKLERLTDVEDRNKVLAQASTGKDIEWRVNDLIRSKRVAENEKDLMAALKDAKIKQAPSSVNRWSQGVETLEEFDLSSEMPVPTDMPAQDGSIFWMRGYGSSAFLVRYKKPKKKVSEEEKQKKLIEARIKQVRDMQKQWEKERREFVRDLLSGKFTKPKKEEIRAILYAGWKLMVRAGDADEGFYPTVATENMANFLSGADRWGDKEEWEACRTLARHAGPVYQMLMSLGRALELRQGTTRGSVIDGSGTWREMPSRILGEYYDLLECFGYQTRPEIREMLAGKSEYFIGGAADEDMDEGD